MDILMPQLGETVAEGTVTNWYKKIGESVRADEALFDVETDKVATEIPCPVSGVLAEVLVAAGQTVKVGTRLAVVRSANEAATATASSAQAASAAASRNWNASDTGSAAGVSQAPAAPTRSPGESSAHTAPHDARQKLSPVVRRLLAEHGLDASAIRGSGRDGRVTRD
ncbi:MAG: biotin/lipoyl-containing protein, partial [Burkholderiales bacterium]